MAQTVMSTSDLPLLRHLPSWSRVGTLDRARHPPIVCCECKHKAAPPDRHSHKTTQTSVGMDTTGPRVASLQKDILFLQQTQKTTLEKLHEEIDYLKRANKELKYQLVMGAQIPSREPSPGGLHENQCQTRVISSEEKPEARHQDVEQNVALIMTLLPLRIHDGPCRPPRTPTLQECEDMIRQLYHANTAQAHELLRLKAVLRDAFNKKKLSPELYNLKKTSFSDNTRSDELMHIPKLTHKLLPKIKHQSQMSVKEKVILPAIRQTLSNNLSERQKRAQDVHRLRLRRPIFS